jgi:hypothetical protein
VEDLGALPRALDVHETTLVYRAVFVRLKKIRRQMLPSGAVEVAIADFY